MVRPLRTHLLYCLSSLWGHLKSLFLFAEFFVYSDMMVKERVKEFGRKKIIFSNDRNMGKSNKSFCLFFNPKVRLFENSILKIMAQLYRPGLYSNENVDGRWRFTYILANLISNPKTKTRNTDYWSLICQIEIDTLSVVILLWFSKLFSPEFLLINIYFSLLAFFVRKKYYI